MKLHLPTGLRHAVMACITALGGIAATSATGTLAIGVALASTALAVEYTPDQIGANTTLNSGDIINLSGNGIGTESTPATLVFAAGNTGVTLNATSGTCTWHVTSASYGADEANDTDTTNDNAGVTTVNVGMNATLNVYNQIVEYTAFNKKAGTSNTNLGAPLNISLGTGATLNSVCQIFGWANTSPEQLPHPGKRTLTMGSGSTWAIKMKNQTDEWLNNTTVTMDNATIQLEEGKRLVFERSSNAIKTTSTATGMSRITGGNLKVGGTTPTLKTIDVYSGCLFEIQRGNFTLDANKTADLRIESALQNGYNATTTEGRGALLKTGNGVLELTNANSDYTENVYVTNGTLKLGGANGQAGSGAITVDSAADPAADPTDTSPQAILELAHSGAATTTNRIDLKEGATLKVTGSRETIGVDSSLLGTVELSHTLLNTAAITLGATTIFDVTALMQNADPTTGAITLISGGTVLGYNLLNMENIRGWNEATAEFSWDGSALTLATTSSTKVYWNSDGTTWGTDTTYKKGENNSATATNYDTIVFNTTPTETLRLGSDITNPVLITGNSTLKLTMGNHNLTGEVTVNSGSTLEIMDMSFTNNLFSKPTWDGEGTIILHSVADDHSGHISLANFNSTVQVSGKFDLGNSVIGSSGTWKLINGESWSNEHENATIANNVIVDNFVLRPDGTYTFTGVVTGLEKTDGTESSVTIGYKNNDSTGNNSTVKFSNAASNISKVNVIKGTVEYNGTDSGDGILFTGDTYLAGNTNMRLTPGDAKATTAADARQYKGAVYVEGTVTVGADDQSNNAPATLTFTDGSMNITGGLHLGETSKKHEKVTLVNSWDKNQFINGLKGTGTLSIIRTNHETSCNQKTGYIALSGISDFTGTLDIGNQMDNGDAVDYNFGMVMLGATDTATEANNTATALQSTHVKFSVTEGKAKSVLVFTKFDTVADGNTWFTNRDTFKANYANGTLAGLSGGRGAVFANELTLGGDRELTYSGELFIEKLIVNRTGKQILAGASDYRYNMAVEVKNGTLAFSGNADVTALTLTSNLEVNGGDVTIGSTTGSGTLKATAGSVTLKNGTHVLGTLDMSNASTATVTVQSGGSLQASTLKSSQNSSIALEDGASFIASDAVTISGEAPAADGNASKVQAAAAADYSIGSEQYTISNATVTATADATIANKLVGSSLINNGGGTVTATNGGNDLTKIEANGGNINLQNVGTTTLEELQSLVIGAGKTVGAHTDTSSLVSVQNEATLAVSDVATFRQGATLNANLELKTGVALTLDGALQMGSTLKLNEGMTLGGGLLAALNRLGVGEKVNLFTGVDTLTLAASPATHALRAGDAGSDASYTGSMTNTVDMHTYFSNVQEGNYVLGYDGGTVYAESLVPEPATATLGLLALAGLCARRRRR